MAVDDHEPTLGEIARRLDRIEGQQTQILNELKADRVESARTYLRQDVWVAERNLLNAALSDTRTDVSAIDGKVDRYHESYKQDRAADATNRRTLVLWLVSLTVSTLVSAAGLIASLVK